jgi:hypothetical protein
MIERHTWDISQEASHEGWVTTVRRIGTGVVIYV